MGCVMSVSAAASAQTADTVHAIRVSTVLVGPVINNRIAVAMTRQNIAVTSESPHIITGTPIEAPDVQIRVNTAEDGEGNIVVISAVWTPGTDTSPVPSAIPVERATHRGKDWQRIEALAAALRQSLVVK